MNNLDHVSSEYLPDAPTSVENDLILHWYPKQITKRIGHCNALLELGVGHGFTASIFNQTCDRHVIIEGSQVVIDLFNKSNPNFNGEIKQGFFEHFITEEKFDVIIMGFILEHVDDPSLILKAYKKHLKPGGKLYIAVPNAKSLNRRMGLELGLIDDIYDLNENDLSLGHQRQFCRKTLTELVESCHYEITHEEGIYLKPLPLNVLTELPHYQENLQAMLKIGVDFPDLCVALLLEVTER